jgi:hypothetical protein
MRQVFHLAWMLLAPIMALASAGFEALLAESELRFDPPPGYVEMSPGRTSVFDYEKAVRSPGGDLEIRFAVRPLQRLRIDYDDPHGAVPDPNHIFPLVFESLASRLAGGRHAPSNAYPPDQAKKRFNADWAAAAVFDTIAEFETPFRQGLLLAIHRNRVADAYAVLLFDDYHAVKPALDRAMASLVFEQVAPQTQAGPGAGTDPPDAADVN